MLNTITCNGKWAQVAETKACYAVEKSFKQEKLKPTPKLPFPQDKRAPTEATCQDLQPMGMGP